MDSERTVATALADYLRQAGVTRVFGYPGESVVDFMEAARDGGPAIVSAVREASAAFMAEGAAMRTGGIGACLSTLGPGSTALLNGVAQRQLDRVPLLAVSGQVDSSREQYWTHQLVDQDRLFAPVTKLAARLEPALSGHRAAPRAADRHGGTPWGGALDGHHGHVRDDGAGVADGTVPPLGPARLRRPRVLRRRAAARSCADGAAAGAAGGRRRGAVRRGARRSRSSRRTAGMPVVVGAMAKGVLAEDSP